MCVEEKKRDGGEFCRDIGAVVTQSMQDGEGTSVGSLMIGFGITGLVENGVLHDGRRMLGGIEVLIVDENRDAT